MDFIYFSLLDADHPSKYLALAFSVLAMVISTPMAAVLVQFEHNCHNRTLINRLIGVEFFAACVWNLTVQMFSLIRYLTGPFPNILCQLEYLMKNILTLFFILMVDFVLIVRYIMVFKLKNPTAVQDEFWIRFLIIWAVGFGLICQTTYLIFPGKLPMSFYFCSGKMHKSLTDIKVKNNPSFNFLVIVTLLVHTYIHIRFFFHKRHETPPPSLPQLPNSPDSTQLRIRSILMNKIKQENLFSLASNAISITVIILSGIAPNILNQANPRLVDVYPTYLWAYLHQLITFNVGILAVCFIYFYKRPTLVRPIKDSLIACHDSLCNIFS